MNVLERRVGIAMTSEKRYLMNIPTTGGEGSVWVVNCCTPERSAMPSTTFDQVQIEIGSPRLRLDSETKTGPRARLSFLRSWR